MAHKLLHSYASDQRAGQHVSVQKLPFLSVLVVACAHYCVMSDSTLMNRLIHVVIPYLAKSILPWSETNNARVMDVSGSSKRKGNEGTRRNEGDEI